MDRHVKGGSQCDPAALAGRIKLRCRYECKATDPCLWFCSHRAGHLFAAQQKKGVSRGQAQILTVKFAPFTSGNRCPSLFLITQLHISFDLFWGRILPHVEFAWFAGAHVGFHPGLRSLVHGPKTPTIVWGTLTCPTAREWEGNRLVIRI